MPRAWAAALRSRPRSNQFITHGHSLWSEIVAVNKSARHVRELLADGQSRLIQLGDIGDDPVRHREAIRPRRAGRGRDTVGESREIACDLDVAVALQGGDRYLWADGDDPKRRVHIPEV